MLKKITLSLIQTYQRYLRIFLPYSCRYIPSCSEYTKLAIVKYGLIQGGLKAVTRICSCHPYSRKTVFDPLR